MQTDLKLRNVPLVTINNRRCYHSYLNCSKACFLWNSKYKKIEIQTRTPSRDSFIFHWDHFYFIFFFIFLILSFERATNCLNHKILMGVIWVNDNLFIVIMHWNGQYESKISESMNPNGVFQRIIFIGLNVSPHKRPDKVSQPSTGRASKKNKN